MKTITSMICLLLILTPISAQTDLGFGQIWQRADDTPLFINQGDSGTWNGYGYGWTFTSGHLLQDGDTLKYYMGGCTDSSFSIGLWYSTSIDSGWQEYSGNPVLTVTPGAWDSTMVGMPCVLKDGETYRMWYVGTAHRTTHGGNNSIGYATSPDGVNWTKHPEPVMVPAPPEGDWAWFNFPYVIDEGDTLKMWYTHSKINPLDEQIHSAYSLDGISWVKYSENPVLSRLSVDNWLGMPYVQARDGGGYVMWATEGFYRQNGSNASTIMAMSEDGISWRRDHLYNPVLKLGANGAWDEDGACITDIVTIDEKQYAIYLGWEDDGWGIDVGLATFEPTIIPAGNVSGTWTKEGSPYRVEGAITVPDAQTLTIEAGATVEFLGNYALNVQGQLLAEGTESARIRFLPVDILGYENEASGGGVWGGIRFDGTSALNDSSLIRYCDIKYSQVMSHKILTGVGGAGVGGGLLVDNFSKLTVDNCLFQYNRAVSYHSETVGLGGAIGIANNSSPKITNNTIQQNKSLNLGNYHDDNGGGIWIWNNSHPLISGNIIRDNRTGDTGGGVAIWQGSNPTLINNLIVKNIAKRESGTEGYGGGLSIGWSSHPILINNTIVDNEAASMGGGIYYHTAGATFINTIIANNTRLNAAVGDLRGHEMGSTTNYMAGQTINIQNSCLEHGPENILYGINGSYSPAIVNFDHSIDLDPRLGTDLKPTPFSPVLGAGTNEVTVDGTTYHAPDVDLEGNLRPEPVGTTPDLGAFESPGSGMIFSQGWHWQEYESNPVFGLGPAGAWDDNWSWCPDVLYFGDQYHMYYAGNGGNEIYSIGHATSSDGINWTRDLNNPIIEGNTAKWYGAYIWNPRVVLVDSVFHMYFYSAAKKTGHATSPDGINWTVTNTPVLSPGSAGTWDDRRVQVADVIHDANGFKMWYSAQNTAEDWAIGYATSSDGINWVKHTNNPVFKPGNTGEWDSNKKLFYGSSVVFNGYQYYMWYCANDGNVHSQIGRAFSSNGVNWFRANNSEPEIPFGPTGSWSDHATFYPAVLLHRGEYKMWYNGKRVSGTPYESIGLTTLGYVDVDPEVAESVIPAEFTLMQNYPNPFNPATQIRYTLPENSEVQLVIYDMLGRELTELVNAEQGQGSYEVQWNGLDQNGHKVPTGIYIAQLRAGKNTETIKMLLLK